MILGVGYAPMIIMVSINMEANRYRKDEPVKLSIRGQVRFMALIRFNSASTSSSLRPDKSISVLFSKPNK